MTPSQILVYEACIESGGSEKLAEMLALQQPPGVHGTAESYSRNMGHHWVDSFQGDEAEAKRVAETLKRVSGYSVRDTDRWEPGLAQSSGDVGGIVPATDPIGHIKRVAEKRDLELHGTVERKRRYIGGDGRKVRLNPRLVKEEMRRVAKAQPERMKDPLTLKHEIVEKYAYNKDGVIV